MEEQVFSTNENDRQNGFHVDEHSRVGGELKCWVGTTRGERSGHVLPSRLDDLSSRFLKAGRRADCHDSSWCSVLQRRHKHAPWNGFRVSHVKIVSTVNSRQSSDPKGMRDCCVCTAKTETVKHQAPFWARTPNNAAVRDSATMRICGQKE